MENQYQIKECSLVKITRILSDGYHTNILSTEIVFLWEVCKEIQEDLFRERKIKIDEGDRITEYVLSTGTYIDLGNDGWYVRIETIKALFD